MVELSILQKIGIIVVALAFFKIANTTIILTILAIVIALLGLIYKFQNKILYIPLIPQTTKSPTGNPPGYRHPSESGINTQDVQIVTSDNVKLRGWYLKNQKSKQIILYFHQNAGNIGYRIPFMKNIYKRTQSDVLLVAYRGFSDSEGEPTEQGLMRDGQAILSYAKQKANGKPIFLLGRSLGGAVSIYLGSNQSLKSIPSGFILENTFTSIKDMVVVLFPFLSYVDFLRKNDWKSIQKIQKINQPILFIRSLRDELVPTQQMKKLMQNAKNCKWMEQHEIKHGTHNSSWQLDPQQYFGAINNFINKVQFSS